MSYRDEDIDAAKDEKNKSEVGVKMDRGYSDIPFCLVFIAAIVAMIGIGGWGISKGDPYKIVTPFDSQKN